MWFALVQLTVTFQILVFRFKTIKLTIYLWKVKSWSDMVPKYYFTLMTPAGLSNLIINSQKIKMKNDYGPTNDFFYNLYYPSYIKIVQDGEVWCQWRWSFLCLNKVLFDKLSCLVHRADCVLLLSWTWVGMFFICKM